MGADREVMLPGGLVIPAGLDPVLADLIGVVNRPDHAAWTRQVERIGGCAHPVHLKGYTRTRDRSTGVVVSEFSSRDLPGGVLLVRCGNRRASRCSSCAYLYQGDVYQLVRAGMDGGKGIPETVSGHPRVFATLTAPSFGPVHTHRPNRQQSGTGAVSPCHPRRTPICEHGQPTACFARHGDDHPVVGTPLCADCYDYTGAVIWQASVGKLWERFCIYLPRHLAKVSSRTLAQVRAEVRVSYVKIVEYQRRGLVHIHAVIRADGTPPDVGDGQPAVPIGPPPEWVTADLLAEAVASAARAVRVRVDGGPVGYWSFGWGTELDVHDITTRAGDDQGAGKVAAYVAKYATKGTEVTGWESWRGPDNERGAHAERMVTAAFGLAEVPELAELKLGRWGPELAYRGHVSSKSRRYSTTLGKLRRARADYQKERARSAPHDGSSGAAEVGRPAGQPEPVGVDRESFWELAGFGYTVGEALLAADVARDVEVNRAAARAAGAARSRAGGRDKLGRAESARERGARVAPGSENHNL